MSSTQAMIESIPLIDEYDARSGRLLVGLIVSSVMFIWFLCKLRQSLRHRILQRRYKKTE